MGMPATHRYWTAADLDEFDDELRREVLHGELFVTPVPAPRHAWSDLRLTAALHPYCQSLGLVGPIGPVELRIGEDLLAPDLAVYPSDAILSGRWTDLPLPLLVVEILSPSTRRRDTGVKRDAYLSLGIPEYWQLDPDTESLTVSRPGAAELTSTTTYVWHPVPDAPAFELPIAPLFT